MTNDDDFLIPRRSRFSRAKASPEGQLGEPTSGRTDPKIVEERRKRKESTAPQPKGVHNNRDEPWKYADRRFGDAFPTFEESWWTLCDAARWIAERTPEAVNGLSIDEERLFEIVSEIREALANGGVRAWAHTPHDPVPRELPRETWAVYDCGIEKRNQLLWIIPFRCSGSPDDENVLIDIRLSREDVLRRWPDEQGRTPSREAGTAGAEHACCHWLTQMMKANPHKPRPKQALREEAHSRFTKLSNRAFDRAWTSAISRTGALSWSAPGRRS
jgi:hypothetical protein